MMPSGSWTLAGERNRKLWSVVLECCVTCVSCDVLVCIDNCSLKSVVNSLYLCVIKTHKNRTLETEQVCYSWHQQWMQHYGCLWSYSIKLKRWCMHWHDKWNKHCGCQPVTWYECHMSQLGDWSLRAGHARSSTLAVECTLRSRSRLFLHSLQNTPTALLQL